MIPLPSANLMISSVEIQPSSNSDFQIVVGIVGSQNITANMHVELSSFVNGEKLPLSTRTVSTSSPTVVFDVSCNQFSQANNYQYAIRVIEGSSFQPDASGYLPCRFPNLVVGPEDVTVSKSAPGFFSVSVNVHNNGLVAALGYPVPVVLQCCSVAC